MKPFLSALILCTLVLCCTDENDETSADKSTVTIDGETWTKNSLHIYTVTSTQPFISPSSALSCGDSVTTFTISVKRNDDRLREHLSFYLKTFAERTYQVKTSRNDCFDGQFVFADFLTANSDVPGDQYDVLETPDNFFTITRSDLPYIEGNFDVTFVIDSRGGDPAFTRPDTIRVLGEFKVKV